MYFSGEIEIDPSQLTEVRRVKPTKAFGRLLYYLTAGLGSARQEHETFTAVSILQQLNMVFRSLGITNIVRLAQDGHDLYHDREGRPDDLGAAMQAHAASAHHHDGPFERLILVLEHEDDVFKYLVQVEIRRVHAVGQAPIAIRINGVPKELRGDAGQRAELEVQLRPMFEDSDIYAAFIARHQRHMEAFVSQITMAIATHMRVTSVNGTTRRKLLRKRREHDLVNGKTPRYDDRSHSADPIFGDYHGFDDHFYYAWYWSELADEYGLHDQGVSIVDEAGHPLLDVGSTGSNARSSTLEPVAPLDGLQRAEDQLCSDVHRSSHASASEDAGGSSWLDSFSFGGSDGDSGGSSDSGGASCGSSCGSSCGGSD